MSIATIIEIKTLPHGKAPESVRGAWIGCVMPCEPECGHVPVYTESVLPTTRTGPLSVGEFLTLPPSEKIDGFSVRTDIALQVLAVRSPDAAAWFERQGYPKEGKCFRFSLEETTVLKTMTPAEQMASGPLVVHDDMETGTMRRVN